MKKGVIQECMGSEYHVNSPPQCTKQCQQMLSAQKYVLPFQPGVMRQNAGFCDMMCIGNPALWAVTVFYYDGSKNNTMMIFFGGLVVKVINDAQLPFARLRWASFTRLHMGAPKEFMHNIYIERLAN